MWDPDVSLQELHHRKGEGQLIGPLLHFGPGQVVLHHELGQVPDNLGGRSHLRGRGRKLLSTKLKLYCEQPGPFFSLGEEWTRMRRRANTGSI